MVSLSKNRKPKKTVYLDHAATTPLNKEVLKAMLPYLQRHYGNPAALYQEGVLVKETLENSRRKIAEILHTIPDSIIFCSGGTESDNLAVQGIAYAHRSFGNHIITSSIEHAAVLEPLRDLQKQGFQVTLIQPTKDGCIDPQEIVKAIRPATILVSVMYANNEIGTIEPIAEIGKGILRYRKEHNTAYPYFHTDACQAAPYLDLDVEKLHVDLLTLNASKMYGPKGSGLLYVRKGVSIKPLIFGGGQEWGKRAGTENVAGSVGFAKAFELVQKNKEKETIRLRNLQTHFWQEIKTLFPQSKLNGPEISERRLVNNLNIYFEGIDAETLLLYLDRYGIMCSAGSACTLQKFISSHVLQAIGLSEKEARSSIRFTLGNSTSKKDLDYTLQSLATIKKLFFSN
jgi:cysteine desulfurase